MIHQIQPHQFLNQYYPATPKPDDYLVDVQDHCVLVQPDHQPFTYQQQKPSELIYLFSIDDHQVFYTSLKDIPHMAINIFTLRSYSPKHLGYILTVASQLIQWYQSHQFCGQCGHPLSHSQSERALVCSHCHTTIYPTISPAIIVAIINDHNQILLTKYASSMYKKYALVAGYNEIGESIEETVHREVFEETGLRIKDLHYVTSQPWPFSSSLLFGFFAKVDGDDTIKIDPHELSVGIWANADEEIDSMDDASLTTYLIQRFKKGDLPW